MAREGEIKNDVSPLTVQYANSAAVAAGEVIAIPGVGVGIACTAGVADATVAYQVRGLVQFPITTAVTISQGDRCYWDISENKVLKTGMVAGDLDLGVAAQAGTAAGGYVQVDLNAPLTIGNISVYDAGGYYKRSYTTVNLAVAALVATDIVIIKSGSYTLTAACNITAKDVQIIGEGAAEVIGAAAADYCFKTVLGAQKGGITFKNLVIAHTDDATQVGIQVNNTSSTGKINVYISNCEFECAGDVGDGTAGNSIDIDHASATDAVRVYITDTTTEGPVNMVTANGGDRLRFIRCDVRGGVVTDAGDYDLEMLFQHCAILYHGISGGHNNQRCIYVNCVSATDDDPNVYALVDGNTNQGSATDQIIGS